jgi:hypothetical protein
VRIGKLFDRRLVTIIQDEVFELPEPTRSKILQDLRTALAMTELNGTIEGRLRLNKLQAEFLEMLGDLAGAKELAARIYPEADAMGFVNIAERAKELLEDRTLLIQFQRGIAETKQSDRDVLWASDNEAESQRFASELLRIIGSPPARAEVVNQYCQSLREIARERLHWCRHLQMLEDLSQTTNPAVAFSVLSDRSCVCDKLGYQTSNVTSDAHRLIETFQNLYCEGCTPRSPKQP